MGLGGGVAASGVETSMVDAEDDPVAQALSTGRSTLQMIGEVNLNTLPTVHERDA